MNRSERLHNQGNEKQSITPELELSRELRATCENLLQEKGRNSFSYKIFFALLAPGANIFEFVNIHLDDNRAQDGLMSRQIVLKEEESKKPNFLIACTGFNPHKALHMDVFITPKNNEYVSSVSQSEDRRQSEVHVEFLRLNREQRGLIMKPQRTGSFRMEADRWATADDLSYYQNQINQSPPIDHK